MAISRTSRYQRNQTALVRDRYGRERLAVLHRSPQDQVLRVSDYMCRTHERIDTVSADFYGSESSWWMIGEANPTVLDWTRPEAGLTIVVPRGLA